MTMTERVGERLKKDVVPRVERMLHRPLPEKILHTKLVQRLGAQALKALDRLTDIAEKAEAARTTKDGEPLVSDKFAEIRKELNKVLGTAQAPVDHKAEQRAAPKTMPEVIKTSGGKRVPASVARRAVKKSGDEFKPKKGQK